MLILKQKEHFRASLNMDIDVLKQVYIKLGEYHYDLRIPYVDFIKGTDILQEHFLVHSNKSPISENIMEDIFSYFKIMKAYTARGYLNRMIKEDQKDIDLFFSERNDDDNSYLPKKVILQKITWLQSLLHAIEMNSDFDIESQKQLFAEWINVSDFISIEKREIYIEIENRIFIDAQNLFYFLARGEFLEILPLYSSLLNIYKLTLILNNALTIEYANKVIDQMKTDSMTGLFRKEIFTELVKKELANLERNNERIFSIIYLDIDDFKNINDTYGHYSGDKVIESIGKVISKNIRASDLGFRIGGDEFAILLKDANLKNANIVAKKILADFTAIKFKFNDKISFKATLSIGVTEQNFKNMTDFKQLTKNVDEKLYFSKKNGKNQITL